MAHNAVASSRWRTNPRLTRMETRTLGASEIAVSVVGLGCNNLGRLGTLTFDQAGTDAVVHAALDAGVTFFDTADVYGAEYGLSETRLGAALKGRRDEAVIATKFGHTSMASAIEDAGPKGSPAYIRAAVEGSLRRLGVESIDLYQQHTPDPSVPIADTLGALDELVREGKVRAIGNSNFDAAQLREADAVARSLGTARFVSAQNHYSLLARGCRDRGAPRRRGAGARVPAVLPARERTLHGQVLAVRYARRHADRPATTRGPRERAVGRDRSSSRPSPPRAGSASSRRLSGGCCRSRTFRASSPERRNPSRFGRTPRPASRGGRPRPRSRRSTGSFPHPPDDCSVRPHRLAIRTAEPRSRC